MQEQAEEEYHNHMDQHWGNYESLESLTYMGDYLAVPHGKGAAVKHNAAALCRCKPFEYESCGESGQVRIIMMLAITDQSDDAKYLKILSSLARLLMNEQFRQAIACANDAQTVLDVGEGILEANEK